MRVDGSAPTRTIPLESRDPQSLRIAGLGQTAWCLFTRRNRAGPAGKPARRARRGATRVGPSGKVSQDRRWFAEPRLRTPRSRCPARSSSSTSTPRTPTRCRPPRTRQNWAIRRPPDGRTVVLGSMDGRVVVADTGAGDVRETFTAGRAGRRRRGHQPRRVHRVDRGTRRRPDRRDLRRGHQPAGPGSSSAAGGDQRPRCSSPDGHAAAVFAANPRRARPGRGARPRHRRPGGRAYAKPRARGTAQQLRRGHRPDGRPCYRGAVASGPRIRPTAGHRVATGRRSVIRSAVVTNGITATTDGTTALVAAGVGESAAHRPVDWSGQARAELPEVNWYAEVQATVAPSPDGQHVAVARGPRASRSWTQATCTRSRPGRPGSTTTS